MKILKHFVIKCQIGKTNLRSKTQIKSKDEGKIQKWNDCNECTRCHQ